MEFNQLIFCNPDLKWTPESLKDKLILIPKTFTPFIEADKIEPNLTRRKSELQYDKSSKIDKLYSSKDNNIYSSSNDLRKIKCQKLKPIIINDEITEYCPEGRSPTENMKRYDFVNLINSKNERSPLSSTSRGNNNHNILSQPANRIFQ